MHLARFLPLTLALGLALPSLGSAVGNTESAVPDGSPLADSLDGIADTFASAVGVWSAQETPPSQLAAEAATVVGSDGFPSYPLPASDPPPLGTPGGFGLSFRDPLPSSPVWNPPGSKRVGLQAGHWLTHQVPNELRRLGPGSSAGGWAEYELNLLLARHTARLLEEAGIEVDVLPTTIPPRYRAHAFVSIHHDGDTAGAYRGYKIARPGFSSIPEADDLFVRTLYDDYGAATGLPRDSDAHISRRMVFYYAFNTRRYAHAIDLGTPSAIIEAGFLTSAADRAYISSNPEIPARGIANGILRFLSLELGARAV